MGTASRSSLARMGVPELAIVISEIETISESKRVYFEDEKTGEKVHLDYELRHNPLQEGNPWVVDVDGLLITDYKHALSEDGARELAMRVLAGFAECTIPIQRLERERYGVYAKEHDRYTPKVGK